MKTVLVTGAYGAIGKAIALKMASLGYETVLAGRDEERLAKASAEISTKTGNPVVKYEVVDLSLKSGITSLASRWNRPLDILINNAASSPQKRMETSEGIEVQFATNVLGYFWMIRNFAPFMKGTPEPRIVNVASYWAGDLDIDDLEFLKRPYDNDTAYRQSKQADRMLTAAFAHTLAADGITVNACHPGDVNSKLSNDLGFGGSETPEEGARNPVWVATDPSLRGITGRYFEYMQAVPCRFASDQAGTERLFRICGSF